MKLKSSKLKYALAAGLVLSGVFSGVPVALAAGVTAGTTVSNSFKVDYKVGGVDQPQKTSTAVTFKVDRKINMTVVGNGTASSVGPGATGQVLGATCTNLLNKNLRYGKKGDDVKKLQTFMNSKENAKLPVTGYFGTTTRRTMKAFQLKYKNEVLTPHKLKSPTGVVGTTTRGKINAINCEK